MANNFLLQSKQPLFPNILWNRPVSARHGGRLLLIGGQAGNFSVPNDIYTATTSAGIGHCQVIFPDSLQKTLLASGIGIFVPANASGSLGKGAVASVLEQAAEYDAVGIGGNLGNNSETTVAIESILSKLDQPVAIYDDALELLRFNANLIAGQPNRLVIATMAELFKLAGRLKIALPAIKEGGVVSKVEIIKTVAQNCPADLVVFGPEIIVCSGGEVTVTSLGYVAEPAIIYGLCQTMWLQNPNKRLEGLTTAAYVLSQSRDQGIYTVAQAATKIRKIIDTESFK